MNTAQRMTMIPVDEVPAAATDITVEVPPAVSKKENSIRKYHLDRQKKLISVILKLAKHGSYDEEGSLRRTDGSKVDGADFISLLHHTMSAGKSIRGLHDFVAILIQAGVTPNELINDSVKTIMTQMMAGGAPRMIDQPKAPSMPIIVQDEEPQPMMEEHSYATHEEPPPPAIREETVRNPPPLLGPFETIQQNQPNKKRRRRPANLPPPPKLKGPYTSVPNVQTKRKATMDREDEEKRLKPEDQQQQLMDAWVGDSDDDEL